MKDKILSAIFICDLRSTTMCGPELHDRSQDVMQSRSTLIQRMTAVRFYRANALIRTAHGQLLYRDIHHRHGSDKPNKIDHRVC